MGVGCPDEPTYFQHIDIHCWLSNYVNILQNVNVSLEYSEGKQIEAHAEKLLIDQLCLSLFCMVNMNSSYWAITEWWCLTKIKKAHWKKNKCNDCEKKETSNSNIYCKHIEKVHEANRLYESMYPGFIMIFQNIVIGTIS